MATASRKAWKPLIPEFAVQLPPVTPPCTSSQGIPPIPDLPFTPNTFQAASAVGPPTAGRRVGSPHDAGYPRCWDRDVTRSGGLEICFEYENAPDRMARRAPKMRGSMFANDMILKSIFECFQTWVRVKDNSSTIYCKIGEAFRAHRRSTTLSYSYICQLLLSIPLRLS